jgi:hypothetical protein
MEPVYLLPVFGGIILTTYSFWIRKVDEKVDKHGERLASLEAVIPKIDKQLDRIEEKLHGR